MVLKTIAEKGSSSLGWRSTFSSVPGLTPTWGPLSIGDGRQATM